MRAAYRTAGIYHQGRGDYIGAENKSLNTHCYSAAVTLENPCGV